MNNAIPPCPHCKSKQTRPNGQRLYYCTACKMLFDPYTHSIIADTKTIGKMLAANLKEDCNKLGRTIHELGERIQALKQDFELVSDIASDVYCHITCGKISKANTCAADIKAVADDCVDDLIKTEVTRQTSELEKQLSQANSRIQELKSNVDELNQILKDTGYGQGQIDAYAAQCEELHKLEETIQELEQKQPYMSEEEIKTIAIGALHNNGFGGTANTIKELEELPFLDHPFTHTAKVAASIIKALADRIPKPSN